ncbi:MAG: thioredoxin family protein [Clostridia bacterium]|nr:thioredoxin family protein [Clostridia bacterium]MBQ5813818.1 thioredoxin family protein [Clostridia bacterium]
MDIKVIGSGCERCGALYDNTVEALAQLGIDAVPTKVVDLMEMVRLGVMTVPSLMINGKLVIAGKVATVKEVAAAIKKAI